MKKRASSFSGKHAVVSLSAAALSVLVFLTGCQWQDSSTPRYSVIGTVSLETPPPFDFSSLFNRLYDSNTQEVFARVLSVDEDTMHIRVDEVLLGDLFRQIEYEVQLPEGVNPSVDTRYLFFIEQSDDGTLTLKNDETGLLRIENQSVVAENESYISQERVRMTSADLGTAITLPESFSLYTDLESLVSGSDFIFVGQLEASEDRLQDFYIESSGSISQRDEATFWRVRVEDQWKGNLNSDELRIVTAPLMLKYTIPSSGRKDVQLQTDSIPDYNSGGHYLFFVIQPPSNDTDAEYLFVNPIQGYVPIVGNSTLLYVYSNPAFVSESSVDDTRSYIESIIESETEAAESTATATDSETTSTPAE